MFKKKLFAYLAIGIFVSAMSVSGAIGVEASFSWSDVLSSQFLTNSSHREVEGSLPQHCPMPICVEPPQGCQYVSDDTVNENGCPAFPCGKLECEPEPTVTPTPLFTPVLIDIDSLFKNNTWFDFSDSWINW